MTQFGELSHNVFAMFFDIYIIEKMCHEQLSLSYHPNGL